MIRSRLNWVPPRSSRPVSSKVSVLLLSCAMKDGEEKNLRFPWKTSFRLHVGVPTCPKKQQTSPIVNVAEVRLRKAVLLRQTSKPAKLRQGTTNRVGDISGLGMAPL
jgi:hypothetical protein